MCIHQGWWQSISWKSNPSILFVYQYLNLFNPASVLYQARIIRAQQQCPMFPTTRRAINWSNYIGAEFEDEVVPAVTVIQAIEVIPAIPPIPRLSAMRRMTFIGGFRFFVTLWDTVCIFRCLQKVRVLRNNRGSCAFENPIEICLPYSWSFYSILYMRFTSISPFKNLFELYFLVPPCPTLTAD